MDKVFLDINGPMCAGKSTVVDTLMKRDGFFRGSFDRVKWLISNYSAANCKHKEIAEKIMLQTITGAMDSGLSIVVDGGHSKSREHYKRLAGEHDFRYISINIEAPYEVLKQRFLERVASAKNNGKQNISVTTAEEFDSRYEKYQDSYKDKSAGLTLDSDKLSLEEIVAEIDKFITTSSN